MDPDVSTERREAEPEEGAAVAGSIGQLARTPLDGRGPLIASHLLGAVFAGRRQRREQLEKPPNVNVFSLLNTPEAPRPGDGYLPPPDPRCCYL